MGCRADYPAKLPFYWAFMVLYENIHLAKLNFRQWLMHEFWMLAKWLMHDFGWWNCFILILRFYGIFNSGWQYQESTPTIQCLLERALMRITKLDRRELCLVGASRTDAGVHAWGQVCHCYSLTTLLSFLLLVLQISCILIVVYALEMWFDSYEHNILFFKIVTVD